MNLRQHKSSLKQSMKTVVEIDNTLDAVFNEIRKDYPQVTDKSTIKLFSYGSEPRIGWSKQYIVYIIGFGVYGFTDMDIV